MTMYIRISVLHFPSLVKILPRYLNSCTYQILVSIIFNLHVRQMVLLTTMPSFLLIFIPFSMISFTILYKSSWVFPFCACYQHWVICISFFLILAANNELQQDSLIIVLLQILNKSGENTPPCLKPLIIFVFLLILIVALVFR